jgi:hypothetical protein
MGFRLDTMVRLGQCVPSLSVQPDRGPNSFPSFVHVQYEFGIGIAAERS